MQIYLTLLTVIINLITAGILSRMTVELNFKFFCAKGEKLRLY